MKKLLPVLFVLTFLFQSCKIYNSRTSTKEDAILSENRVRVKSTTNSSYKFEKLILEGDQLYGIGMKQSSKSKSAYNDNIVNVNKSDKNVKIRLTDDLVNEIHLYSKGKSTALKVFGIGATAVYVVAAAVVVVLLSAW